MESKTVVYTPDTGSGSGSGMMAMYSPTLNYAINKVKTTEIYYAVFYGIYHVEYQLCMKYSRIYLEGSVLISTFVSIIVHYDFRT